MTRQVIYYANGTVDSTEGDGIDFFRRNGGIPDLLQISEDNKFVMRFRDSLYHERLTYNGVIKNMKDSILMLFDKPVGNPNVILRDKTRLILSKEYNTDITTYQKVIKEFHKANLREDLGNIFKSYGVIGTIMVYDEKKQTFTIFNQERARTPFIPASTFKIFNSLVGLEYHAVNDENEIIKWDGVKRSREELNKDMDMREAFRISSVWFYQEIARSIGAENMQKALTENRYGNMNMNGGLDRFWLDGEIKISPEQQIDFLRRLYFNKLNFSSDVINKVKNMMLLQEENDYKLFGKTGWAQLAETDIGWFVGYAEKGSNVYFFAVNVESPLGTNPKFGASRRAIAEKVLQLIIKDE